MSKVIQRSKRGNVIEYHVLGLEDSEYFDTLISFFQKQYNAEILSEDNGIHTRRTQLRCKDESFFLEHNEDIGNWFYSCETSGDSRFMVEIAKELEGRLSDIPYEPPASFPNPK